MNSITLDDRLGVFVEFAGSPTGYISAESVSEGPMVYPYMPLRNWPHLKLSEVMQEQGQAEVSVRLKSGPLLMIVTALSTRSITLKAAEKFRRPIGLAEGEFVVPDDFDDRCRMKFRDCLMGDEGHVLIRSNAAGINTRLHSEDATKYRFCNGRPGRRGTRNILTSS